jgi:hypothetical protein
MLLILSSKMVNEDIALHYGRLPPSFLPLGNRRLFSFQAELGNGDPVAMTVPENYEISDVDRLAIDSLGIQLIPLHPNLPLTEAISVAVTKMNLKGSLRLLYGDTLIRETRSAHEVSDQITVQSTTSNYQWAYVVDNKSGIEFSDASPRQLEARQVVCGDFTFSDPTLLVRACSSGNIVDALNAYQKERPFNVVEANEWFDFGHLPLYFQSKKTIMINRVFNSLTFENHLLVKQSADTAKIRAEAQWYETLPKSLMIHTPRYQGRVERGGKAGYAIEYLYHPLLSDLDAFGALPLPSWLEILNACFDLIRKYHSIRPDSGAPEASEDYAKRFFENIIVGKTWLRLETYISSVGLSLDDTFTVNGVTLGTLREVVSKVIKSVPKTTPGHIRYWHGDMFFGNMFYDFTGHRIMVIDPRGQLSAGETTLYGDWRYDIAKLAHSVIGKYDRIILGRSTFEELGDRDWSLSFNETEVSKQVEGIFRAHCNDEYGLCANELSAITSLLFFSMLPLHNDRPDLQKMMLANALRIAAKIEGNDL